MKNPLVLALLALVLGGAALVLSLLNRPPHGFREGAEPVALSPDDSLALRVDELVEENRGLRDRVAALEMVPVPVAGARVVAGGEWVAREEFDAFRDEVRAALAELGSVAKVGADPAALKDSVASALTEVRREEAVGKVRAKQEARLERLDQTMPKMESWLELTPQQSDRMRSALLAQYEREAELTRRWQAGEDPEVLGELKRGDRETHRAELSGFLSAEQMERYTGSGGKGGE